jgi:hypothetical protein
LGFGWILFFVLVTVAGELNRGDNIAYAAEKLLDDVRETHYQHKTHVLQSAGIYDMDCSGFVDFLLKRVAPQQYVIFTSSHSPSDASLISLWSFGNPEIKAWLPSNSSSACC